jgi:hypothetical protein
MTLKNQACDYCNINRRIVRCKRTNLQAGPHIAEAVQTESAFIAAFHTFGTQWIKWEISPAEGSVVTSGSRHYCAPAMRLWSLHNMPIVMLQNTEPAAAGLLPSALNIPKIRLKSFTFTLKITNFQIKFSFQSHAWSVCWWRYSWCAFLAEYDECTEALMHNEDVLERWLVLDSQGLRAFTPQRLRKSQEGSNLFELDPVT